MNNDWTDDIRNLMSGYEVNAPEGLLEDVKKNIPTKARVVPMHRFRWVAAAAMIAAVAMPVFWYLSSQVPEPLATAVSRRHVQSSSTQIHAKPSSASNPLASNPITYAYSQPAVTEPKGLRYDVTGNNGLTAMVGSAQDAAGNGDKKAGTEEAPQTKRQAVRRHPAYQDFADYDATAYESTQRHEGRVSLGAYYGGMAGSNGGIGSGMPVVTSDAAPYGNYPSNMASAETGYIIGTGSTARKAHHKQPIKAGVSIAYRINNRWSVQTGITYSYLSSDFTSDYEPTETQKLHYVGIPLTASYSIVKGRKAEVYVTAGGEVEQLVKGKMTTGDNETVDVKENRPQWSVKAAVGAAYHFTPALSVYAEPGVSHHFNNHSDVENVYKDKPTSFSLNLGFRININKK